MLRALLMSRSDYGLFAVRCMLGVVTFAHGAQKMLGWFGGHGLDAALASLTEGMGLPAPLALLAICAEFFGGLGLIVGLMGRVAAFGIGVVMFVATFLVHPPDGFFVNWLGNPPGEGFEYPLLAIGMCAAILIHGSGALSLDHLLYSKLERARERASRSIGSGSVAFPR